jgi:ADP-glucose pyrophosphorylase
MIGDESLIEHISQTYFGANSYLTIYEHEDAAIPKNLSNNLRLIGKTQGALISALLSLEERNLDKPLFIVPGDSLIRRDRYEKFVEDATKNNADISVVVFKSDNSNYSYVRTRDSKLVEVCEKKVISSNATAGIFYFSTARLFLECAEWAITYNIRTNDNFYVAPCLNFAVIQNFKIKLFEILEDDYFRFSNYEEALNSRERFIRGSS